MKIEGQTKNRPTGKQQAKETEQAKNIEYRCGLCGELVKEEPEDESGQSIGCDNCDTWYHYGCLNISGNERFLKKKKWFCDTCAEKSKSKCGEKGQVRK